MNTSVMSITSFLQNGLGNGGTAERLSVLRCNTMSLGKNFPVFEVPHRQHVVGLLDCTDIYIAIIQNGGNYSPNDTMSHPRRHDCSVMK